MIYCLTHSLAERISPLAKQVEEAGHRGHVWKATAVEHGPIAEADGHVIDAVEEGG